VYTGQQSSYKEVHTEQMVRHFTNTKLSS